MLTSINESKVWKSVRDQIQCGFMYVYVQNKLDFTRGANSRGDQNNILSVGENGKTIENYFSALNLPAISHPPTSSNWLVYFGLAKKNILVLLLLHWNFC